MATTVMTTRSFGPELSSGQALACTKQVLEEALFHNIVSLERKRSERNQRPFVLLIVETEQGLTGIRNNHVLLDVLSALQTATRETDLTGWYKEDVALGVILTEILPASGPVEGAILSRLNAALSERLTNDQLRRIKFRFWMLPEDWTRYETVPEITVGVPLHQVQDGSTSKSIQK